jgi:glycosyltransferase involved in cell wall biosynthesis
MALRVLSGSPPWLVRRSKCAWQASFCEQSPGIDLLAEAGSFPRRPVPAPPFLPEGTLLVGALVDGERAIESRQILAACGGIYAPGARKSLFGRQIAPYTLPPVRALAGHPATLARYAPIAEEAGLDGLLATAAAAGVRIVHHPALDASEDRRRRVLFVVTSLHRGGAERLVLDVVGSSDLKGIVPFLARTHDPIRAAFPEPPGTILLPRLAPAAPLPFLGIDAIYLHLIDGAVARSLAAFGVPVATCVHNAPDGWPAALVERDAPIALYLGCGEAVTTSLRGVLPASRVRPLTNGIVPRPPERARSQGNSLDAGRRRLRILVVANVRPQKRLDRLPAILDGIHGREPHAECTIFFAGEAVSQNEASRAAEEALGAALAASEYAKLPGNFLRLGPREDIPELLAEADVLLLPSAWEGVPLVVLEALAASVPVVATAVGGLPELASRHPGRVTLVATTGREESEIVAGLASALLALPLSSPAAGLHPVHTARSYARRTARALRALVDRPSKERVGPARIVLITNHFHVGGAQTSARRLLAGLAARGVPVAAIVLEEQAEFPTVGTQALRSRTGIAVHCTPSARTHAIVDVAEDALEFAAAFGATTVFFWNALFEVKALFAESFSGARLFDVSPGEMYFASMSRYFARPNAESSVDTPARFAALLDGVVVKYKQEIEAAEALGAPVTVIPNGVLPAEDRALPSLPRPARPIAVLGTLARLSPDKKLEELIEAFRLLPPDLGLTLRIAGGEDGDAAYADRLRASVADVPAIAFVGHQEAFEFLGEVDLFVAISEPAGCPNATLEALVYGVPVVATDHGAARDQVAAEDLVPRGDPRRLADAILARCTDWRSTWDRTNRAVVRDRQRFSVDRFVDDYLALSRSFSTS